MKALYRNFILCAFLFLQLLSSGCHNKNSERNNKDIMVVEDLFKKGDASINKSFDSTWSYAVKLSGFQSIRAQFYSNKLKMMFFFTKGDNDSALSYGRKNTILIKKLDDKKENADLLNRLGNIFTTKGNYDSAAVCIKNAIEIYREIGDIKQSGAIISNLGYVYLYRDNYSKAIELFDSSRIISTRCADTAHLMISYNGLALVYSSLSDYQKAADYYEKAVYCAKACKNQHAIALILQNLGTIYSELQKENLALDFYNESEHIYAKLGYGVESASVKINIGQIYSGEGKTTKALTYFNESLNMFTKLRRKDFEAMVLLDIGTCLMQEKKVEQAKFNIEKSLEIKKELEDYEGISICYKELANIYLEKRDYSTAEKFFQQSVEIAAKNGYKLHLLKAYQGLSELFEKTRMFEKSLHYHKLYKDYSDSIFNEKNNQQVTSTNIRFETAKKQAEIEKLNHEKLVQKQRLHFQYILILAITVISIAILVIAVLLFRQRKLKHENQLSQTKQKLLRSQMNPHFIFNALSAIQSYVYENEPIKTAAFIGNFAVLMRSILEGSINDFISLATEIEIVKNYLTIQQLRFKGLFEYKLEVDPLINTEDILIPPMLTQPFLENAIEHGLKKQQKDGQIKISYMLKEDLLKVTVLDNGSGFDLSATKTEKHVSRAVEITRERLSILQKEMKKELSFSVNNLKDEKETGVLVEFSIPLVHVFE